MYKNQVVCLKRLTTAALESSGVLFLLRINGCVGAIPT